MRAMAARRASLGIVLATALAFGGCASGPTKPVSKFDNRARCVETRGQQGTEVETYTTWSMHCLMQPLTESTCRDAIVRSVYVAPNDRTRLVTLACASAYCPRLKSAKKPGLCADPHMNAKPSELRELANELFVQVRELELGAKEAARWHELAAFAPVPVEAVAPPPEPSALTVQVAVERGELVITLAPDTWRLPASAKAPDYEPAARQITRTLGDPKDKLVIAMSPGLQYAQLIGLLNALGTRKVRNVSIVSATRSDKP